jgi:hypothetical protein
VLGDVGRDGCKDNGAELTIRARPRSKRRDESVSKEPGRLRGQDAEDRFEMSSGVWELVPRACENGTEVKNEETTDLHASLAMTLNSLTSS